MSWFPRPDCNHELEIIDTNERFDFENFKGYTERTLKCTKCKIKFYDNNYHGTYKYNAKKASYLL